MISRYLLPVRSSTYPHIDYVIVPVYKDFFFRIVGLWVIENSSNPIPVFTDLCSNCDDLMIVTNDGCILSGIGVIIFKMFNFQIRAERIRSISEKVHKPVDVLDRSSGVRAIMRIRCLYEKFWLINLWITGEILAIALMVVPVEEGQLPIRAQYPFKTTTFPMRSLAFFMQASTVTVGLIAITCMDRMVVGLFTWMNVQIVVLRANYENCAKANSGSVMETSEASLTNDTGKFLLQFAESEYPQSNITRFIVFNDDEARAIRENDSFVMRYKLCVKHHQRVIRTINEMNEIFRSSMCVQLFTSFSMICLAGFQTVFGANDLSSFIKFSVYLGAASIQLLNWCWVGNCLVHQSASLSTSQWLSGWEDYLTPEVLPLMTVSMAQSNKFLSLQAGKFFIVTMQTFILIIRNCYSFFAILKEKNDEDN